MSDFDAGQMALNTEESPVSGLADEGLDIATQQNAEGFDNLGDDPESLNQDQESGGQRKSEHVPYDQFQKSVHAQRAAEATLNETWDELVDAEPRALAYRQAGYSPRETIRALRQENAQQEAAQKQVGGVHGALKAWEEEGEVSPRVAGELAPFLESLLNRVAQVEPLAERFRQNEQEAAVTRAADSLLKEYKEADRETVEDYLRHRGLDAARNFAKKDHERITAVRKTSVANYNAETAKRSAAVVPERGSGGQNPGRPGGLLSGAPDSKTDPVGWMNWFTAQANKTAREAG